MIPDEGNAGGVNWPCGKDSRRFLMALSCFIDFEIFFGQKERNLAIFLSILKVRSEEKKLRTLGFPEKNTAGERGEKRLKLTTKGENSPFVARLMDFGISLLWHTLSPQYSRFSWM